MEYKILEYKNIIDLEKNVNIEIKNGYMLSGGMCGFSTDNYNSYFQAMYKPETKSSSFNPNSGFSGGKYRKKTKKNTNKK